MIAWLLLKGLPAFAAYLGLPGWRTVMYAFLAAVVVLAFAARCRWRVPNDLQGFGLLATLFLLVIVFHLNALVGSETAAEIMVNLRGLFLIITLGLLLWVGTPAGTFLLLFTLCLAATQVVSLVASANVLSTATADVTRQRIGGIYGGSFTVGYAAAAVTGVALILRELSRSRAVRLAALATAGLGVLSSFLSINRSSIVALVLVICGWLFERVRRGSFGGRGIAAGFLGPVALLLLVLSAAVVVVMWVAPELVRYYSVLWTVRLDALQEAGGQESRLLTIMAGSRMFLDHPLVGVGWDQAANYSLSYGADMASTAHNVFVQGAAEGGLLGLGYVVGLFVLLPVALFRRGAEVPGRYVFAGAWAGILFFNLIASDLHLEGHWDLLMAWIMAIGVWEARHRPVSRAALDSTRGVPGLADGGLP